MPETFLGLGQAELGLKLSAEGLTMSASEVIGDQSYATIKSAGLGFVFADNEHVSAVQMYSFGHEGFAAYASSLPAGLDFGMPQKRVRDLCGLPDRFRGEFDNALLGAMPAWDYFIMGQFALHVEYTMDRTAIRLVTLTRPRDER